METLKPGVYHWSIEEYHADPCPEVSLSSSSFKSFMNMEPFFDGCPALFKYKRENPDKPKDCFDFGNIAHKLILGEGAKIEVIDHPDYRKKDAQNARDEAREGGKIPILRKDYNTAKEMADAVFSNKELAAIFKNGEVEKSLTWQDPQTGVWLRSRPDLMNLGGKRGFIVDYKTCLKSSKSAIEKTLVNYGYVVQAALAIRGVANLGLHSAPVFIYIFQEKTPPYIATVVFVQPETIEYGQLIINTACHELRECIDSGHWPGYTDGLTGVGLPYFAEKQLIFLDENNQLKR